MAAPSKVLLVFFLLKITLAYVAQAQCSITVNAGPDKFVCNPGQTVQLDGSITGTYIGLRWTPATGLSDPFSLTPTATVNAPLTYTLTGAAFDPAAPNLVNNPGFEAGNTGFTSGFAYNPTPITPGTYVITTSPSLVLSTFPPCDDHTFGNGTGNMMLVNGNASGNAQIWCQTIPVMANSWYSMSAWVASSPISPPELQFSANGTFIGSPFQASGGGCSWEEFTATWFSGAATSVTLCIVDRNGSGNGFFGDDFVLDDIFMSKACTVTDQVSVAVAVVNAVLPPSVILPCSAQQNGIQLNGSGSSSGPGYTYSWSGPGIISGENTPIATVNEPGVYTLTVSFDTGNEICTASASINVLPDPNQVTAAAVAIEELNCLTTTALLDGSGSSTGPTISYNWQPAASVVTGQGTLAPTVNQPGFYTLTVTHNPSGCTQTATAFVSQNIAPATAAAATPGPLLCKPDTVKLNGTGSSTGFEFSYAWAGPGIVSGANTLNNCVVNAPGVYTLTVTNQLSGCTAKATVAVTANKTPPTAQAAADPPGSLGCNADSLTLNSAGSSTGPNISYQWSTPNGNVTGPVNGPAATVDTLGLYILNVTNTQNGCTATDTVTVQADSTAPTIAIALPLPKFFCNTDSVQLDAGPSKAAGFSINWKTPNGTILSADTILKPWIGSPGLYILTIADTIGGCTAVDTVSVGIDTLAPVAAIGPPAMLDCQANTVQLDASGSSDSLYIGLAWSFIPAPGASGPGFVSGQNSLMPAVELPGLYILTLLDSTNFCTAVDTAQVLQDIAPPLADAGPDGLLTCVVSTDTLDAGSSSQGPAFTYLWTGGDTTLQTFVSNPGLYFLTVTNTENHCSAIDSVFVELLNTPPTVSIDSTGMLTCAQPVVQLNAQAAAGAQLNYLWSGPGILSGATTLSPTVNAAGLYTLTVSNALTGCTASATASLQQSADIPQADAGPPQTLFCGTTSVSLDGSLSAAGPDIVYSWTTSDGNILDGANTLTPEVNTPGTYTLLVTDTLTGCSAFDIATVQLDANAPAADAGTPQTLTCLVTALNLDGSNSSTGPEFSYLWTTPDGQIQSGATTLTPYVTAPGTYFLQVTNTINNCQALASVQVLDQTQPPQAVAAAPQMLTCAVSQVSLNGTGSSAGTYSWSGPGIVSGSTTLTPVVNAAGVYTLQVTDTSNGCTATATAIVIADQQAPQAVAAAPQLLTCAVSQVSLNGTGSSAGTYSWSGPGIVSGATTLTPVVNAAGVYTLQVTGSSNGCTATATTTVSADQQAPQAVAAAPQLLTCAVSQVSLNGTGSSAGTYSWSGPGIVSGATTLTPVVNAAGVYTLQVTGSSNGCTATATTTVSADQQAPQAVAAAPQLLTCAVSQVSLNGTGSSAGTYSWSGPGIVSGATTLTPVVNAAGVYTLQVTDTSNGCTATAQTTVNQNTSPPNASAGADLTLPCDPPAIALQGSSTTPGALFSWQTGAGNIVSGQNTATPLVDAPGVYILTVSNPANGCTASSLMTVQALQTIFPSILTTTPNCAQPTGSILFTGGQGPFLYSINNGATLTQDSLFANLPPGAYQTLVQDAAGCEQQQLVVLAGIKPLVISLPPADTLAPGATIALNLQLNIPPDSVATVIWTPAAGLSCSDCLNPTAAPSASASYTATVTALNGCTASAAIALVVRTVGEVYLPNVFSPNLDGVNDLFLVQTALAVQNFDMQIFDRWGGLLFRSSDINSGWDGSAKGRAMNPGVYAYMVRFEYVDGGGKVQEFLASGDVLLTR